MPPIKHQFLRGTLPKNRTARLDKRTSLYLLSERQWRTSLCHFPGRLCCADISPARLARRLNRIPNSADNGSSFVRRLPSRDRDVVTDPPGGNQRGRCLRQVSVRVTGNVTCQVSPAARRQPHGTSPQTGLFLPLFLLLFICSFCYSSVPSVIPLFLLFRAFLHHHCTDHTYIYCCKTTTHCHQPTTLILSPRPHSLGFKLFHCVIVNPV